MRNVWEALSDYTRREILIILKKGPLSAGQIYEYFDKNNVNVIDYTCPKVLKIHKIAEEYKEKNYFIILVGVENHPESIGTISFCGENSYMIRDKEDIEKAYQKLKQSKLEKVLIIAQTTYNMKKFEICYIIEKY